MTTGILRAFEASAAAPRADALAPSADYTGLTADAFNTGDVASFTGMVAAGAITGILAAAEGSDVAAFAGFIESAPVVIIGGGRLRLPPLFEPIEGFGFGILPELEGEAHGVVRSAGIGAAMPHIPAGEAAGAIFAGGQGEARIIVAGASKGVPGTISTGAAIIGSGRAAGSAAVIARGDGATVVYNPVGRGRARQDDDLAVIAWLLAA